MSRSPAVHRVGSVGEAIALAEKWRADGSFDYFRGQRQPWPIRSSLQRSETAARQDALAWFERFRNWLSHVPGLWAMAADLDQATAVAQHYGLQTDFIDITSEPGIAAFFALDGALPDQAELCSIACINSADLRRLWKKRYGDYRPPEVITPTVPNLWRLEAQRGAFLYCPYSDFEALYPPERILFPPGTAPTLPSHDYVYPERKSALEILLDQFFLKRTISTFNDMMAPLMHTLHFEGPTERYEPTHVVGGVLSPLESWRREAIESWRRVSVEAYDEAVGTPLSVRFDLDGDPSSIRAGVREALLEAMAAAGRDARSHASNFTLTGASQRLSPEREIRLGAALSRLWDGLRRLPYSDAEVVEGIGVCVGLELAHADAGAGIADQKSCMAAWRVLGEMDMVIVEFGLADRSYSRAVVSEARLRAAMRRDLYDVVVPESRELFRDHIDELLRAIHAPERLLEFRELAHLFAIQLAPTQVLTRTDPAIVVYSPVQLITFGLP